MFFEDAIDHFLRISRIISRPRGNALLIALIGSGRTCLTKIACFTHNI